MSDRRELGRRAAKALKMSGVRIITVALDLKLRTRKCRSGFRYNRKLRKCVRTGRKCRSGYRFSPGRRKCVRVGLRCLRGYRYNPRLRKCVRSTRRCRRGYRYSPGRGKCVRFGVRCRRGYRYSPQLRKCVRKIGVPSRRKRSTRQSQILLARIASPKSAFQASSMQDLWRLKKKLLKIMCLCKYPIVFVCLNPVLCVGLLPCIDCVHSRSCVLW